MPTCPRITPRDLVIPLLLPTITIISLFFYHNNQVNNNSKTYHFTRYGDYDVRKITILGRFNQISNTNIQLFQSEWERIFSYEKRLSLEKIIIATGFPAIDSIMKTNRIHNMEYIKHIGDEKGEYSPLKNIIQAIKTMNDYSSSSVLYVHDDVIITRSLVKRFNNQWIHGNFSPTKNNCLHKDGRVLGNWPISWPHAKRSEKELKNVILDPNFNRIWKGSSSLPCSWGQSDILYLPLHNKNHRTLFIYLCQLFYKHHVFIETAIPTILAIMKKQFINIKIEKINLLCTSWDYINIRNKGEKMIEQCLCNSNKIEEYDVYHPLKINILGEKRWSSIFRLILDDKNIYATYCEKKRKHFQEEEEDEDEKGEKEKVEVNIKSPPSSTSTTNKIVKKERNEKDLWIVVVTVSNGFDDMFYNWFYWYQKLNLNMKLIMIAEDSKTYIKYKKKFQSTFHDTFQNNIDVYKSNGVQFKNEKSLTYNSSDYKTLVSKRPMHLLRVFNLSYTHIIYTDVDTVWLKDPRVFLKGNYDFYAQMDFTINETIRHAYCTGFLAFVKTSATLMLLNKWNEQLQFNHRLNQPVFNDIVQKMKNTVRPKSLPSNRFPSGKLYFKEHYERNKILNDVVIIHNNFITGKINKINRWKNINLWVQEDYGNDTMTQ